jgi:hypothetical protein
MSKLSKINHEQRLYVIDCGEGYSCLGFDVLETRAARLAKALCMTWTANLPASEMRYEQYEKLLSIAHDRVMGTGIRMECELHPSLHGTLHQRVEVVFADGSVERFRVGKSTGWIPIYLRLKNSKSRGGEAIGRDEKISSVKVIS